jgi:hypothetical protein
LHLLPEVRQVQSFVGPNVGNAVNDDLRLIVRVGLAVLIVGIFALAMAALVYGPKP